MGGIIKLILLHKTSCELDPLRLQDGDPDEPSEKVTSPESLKNVTEKHTKSLTEFVTLLLDNIFKNVESLPASLKVMFGTIQTSVRRKFPDDEVASYTGVSGFLFLRFFVPAILGPKLFGLNVGPIGPKSSRLLTLISKVIQNLANLVEFGQKELFMAPMNTLIKSKLGDMRLYLNAISVSIIFNC